jgi:hypothetical protein
LPLLVVFASGRNQLKKSRGQGTAEFQLGHLTAKVEFQGKQPKLFLSVHFMGDNDC